MIVSCGWFFGCDLVVILWVYLYYYNCILLLWMCCHYVVCEILFVIVFFFALFVVCCCWVVVILFVCLFILCLFWLVGVGAFDERHCKGYDQNITYLSRIRPKVSTTKSHSEFITYNSVHVLKLCDS